MNASDVLGRLGVPDKEGKIRSPEYWLSNTPWVTQYRGAMFWCACLADWKSAKQLSAYPLENVVDEASQRKSEAPWYKLLASYLRGHGALGGQELLDASGTDVSAKEGSFERLIEEGRSKRMKLLYAGL